MKPRSCGCIYDDSGQATALCVTRSPFQKNLERDVVTLGDAYRMPKRAGLRRVKQINGLRSDPRMTPNQILGIDPRQSRAVPKS